MAKKKEMNRTSGTARRLTGRSEGIATKLKYGAPLTGSASGVKSISLKDAGEVLTQGIVTLGKKGLKFAPEGLAMALPVGKVAKAAQALRTAGKMAQGFALEGRLAAKTAGKLRGVNIAERSGRTPIEKLSQGMLALGNRARKNSEKIYPRKSGALSGEFSGMNSREITANLGRKIGPALGLKNDAIRELSKATKNSTTGFTKFSKGASKRGK